QFRSERPDTVRSFWPAASGLSVWRCAAPESEYRLRNSYVLFDSPKEPRDPPRACARARPASFRFPRCAWEEPRFREPDPPDGCPPPAGGSPKIGRGAFLFRV